MWIFDVHPFKGLFEQDVSQLIRALIVERFEHNMDNKIDKVCSDNVGVPDQVKCKFDEFVS